jgi:hypothetical protein
VQGAGDNWTPLMYQQPLFPARSSQTAIVERLVSAGVRAEAIADAIALLQTGAVDLIEAVIAGKLTVERALKLVRQRRGRR